VPGVACGLLETQKQIKIYFCGLCYPKGGFLKKISQFGQAVRPATGYS